MREGRKERERKKGGRGKGKGKKGGREKGTKENKENLKQVGRGSSLANHGTQGLFQCHSGKEDNMKSQRERGQYGAVPRFIPPETMTAPQCPASALEAACLANKKHTESASHEDQPHFGV